MQRITNVIYLTLNSNEVKRTYERLIEFNKKYRFTHPRDPQIDVYIQFRKYAKLSAGVINKESRNIIKEFSD